MITKTFTACPLYDKLQHSRYKAFNIKVFTLSNDSSLPLLHQLELTESMNEIFTLFIVYISNAIINWSAAIKPIV